MVAAMGPATWGTPFYAQTEEIAVNLLAELEFEFKSLVKGVEYEWDFGDTSPPYLNGYEVTHRFTSPGVFTIKVSVDNKPPDEITITIPGGQLRQLPEPQRRKRTQAAA